jgi:hypothetical protein
MPYKDAARRRENSRKQYAENPGRFHAASRAWAKRNPEKVLVGQRQWRERNPAKWAAYQRRAAFKQRLKRRGITEAEYTRLWLAQGCKCGICARSDTGTKRSWHLDHDHATGKARGILCHGCNLMLGHAKDQAAILRAGVEWLEKHHD